MDTERFLRESPVAALVRLPGRVVVERGAHSLSEVRAIAEAGTYAPVSGSGRLGRGTEAELEVSGVGLARGRVVRKGGRLFFKVLELTVSDGGTER